jgi:hypothetical protein
MSIYVGTIGTAFDLEIRDDTGTVVDLAEETTLTMIFRKPNGDVIQREAEAVAGDGVIHENVDDIKYIMRYLSVEGDIDVAGKWKRQGYIVLPEWSGHTLISEFKVEEHL